MSRIKCECGRVLWNKPTTIKHGDIDYDVYYPHVTHVQYLKR